MRDEFPLPAACHAKIILDLQWLFSYFNSLNVIFNMLFIRVLMSPR